MLIFEIQNKEHWIFPMKGVEKLVCICDFCGAIIYSPLK
jgi:hypothetical protein